MKVLALSGLILLSALLTLSSGRAIQAPLSVDLSFTVYSESLEPVSGARVKVDGATGLVLNSDAEGHTTTIQSTVGALYDVHLKERALPLGTLVGQSIYGYVVPASTLDASTSQIRLWETILTQPVLRPVLIDSTTHRVSSPADVLWAIDIDEANHDTFSFPALVGSLSTADSVAAYLDYCNVDPLEPNYRYALAIRTQEVESFGSHGAVIALDCSTFGFTQEPIVDLCFVATSTPFFGATTLSIDDTYWTGGVLGLTVGGDLGIGTTLLLVRPDGGSANGLHEAVAQPPTFGPATAPNGSGASLQAQRCTPPTPAGATEEECIPPEPPAHFYLCPPPTKCGPAVITSDVRRVGAKVCGNGGPPQEITGTTDWGASLSAKFNLAGVEVTAGGNLKRTESTKTTSTPGAGGCGECKQVFKIRAFCKQNWTKEVPTFGLFYPHPFQGCEDEKASTGTVTEITQETSCPMTGC